MTICFDINANQAYLRREHYESQNNSNSGKTNGQSGEHWSLDYKIQRKSPKFIWIDFDPDLVGNSLRQLNLMHLQ
jgi:hypothetical protein